MNDADLVEKIQTLLNVQSAADRFKIKGKTSVFRWIRRSFSHIEQIGAQK